MQGITKVKQRDNKSNDIREVLKRYVLMQYIERNLKTGIIV